jgi:hypothetical protein
MRVTVKVRDVCGSHPIRRQRVGEVQNSGIAKPILA